MTKRVLAVDDSKMVRDLMSYMVASGGYEAETAENGAMALEMLAQQRFDLALVDLNMPLMDGYTLVENIRGNPEWEDIAVIIVTTEAEAEDRRRGLEAGADLYLVKPVDEVELLTNIKMLIGDPDG